MILYLFTVNESRCFRRIRLHDACILYIIIHIYTCRIFGIYVHVVSVVFYLQKFAVRVSKNVFVVYDPFQDPNCGSRAVPDSQLPSGCVQCGCVYEFVRLV